MQKRFMKKYLSFWIGVKKGLFCIFAECPFYFCAARAYWCVAMYNFTLCCTVYTSLTVSCRPYFAAYKRALPVNPSVLNSGQNYPNMLYTYMCRNSAATTGSGAWCGSGIFFYFSCLLYFDLVPESRTDAAPAPYVNLFCSPIRSRYAEREL
jgi:hypothetical protein